MNYTIRQIEDAIITALSPLLSANGGPLKTVASYEGQFGEAVDAANQTMAVLPAALVTFTGAACAPSGAPLFTRTVRFAVLHGSSNLASERARRRDVYTLLDSTRPLLNNSSLGLDITPLLLERETVAATGRALTIIGAEYRTTFLEDSSQY